MRQIYVCKLPAATTLVASVTGSNESASADAMSRSETTFRKSLDSFTLIKIDGFFLLKNTL